MTTRHAADESLLASAACPGPWIYDAEWRRYRCPHGSYIGEVALIEAPAWVIRRIEELHARA